MFNIFNYIYYYIYYEIWYYFQKKEQSFKDLGITTPNNMLILYIHGLNGSPSRVDSNLKQLQLKYPNALIIAPKLPSKNIYVCRGYINTILKTYRGLHPYTKIFVIGYSYGGRIAYLIEKKGNIQNIEYIYIAVPFRGTKITPLLAFFSNLKPKIINKLIYKKNKYLEFDSRVHKYFIYSDMDERIIPTSSCIPKAENSEYKCFPNYSHKTLLHVVWNYIGEVINQKAEI